MQKNYFTTPGGIKKFQQDSGIAQDVSNLNIRQVIKRKNWAKYNLDTYYKFFSSHKKRLAYTRYLRATIQLCSEIQGKRRQEAIDYYYSLPKEERTPKNWIKYTSMVSDSKRYGTK